MEKHIAICVLLPLAGLAENMMVDGVDWTYTVSKGEAQVSHASPASGSVVIPSTLGGFPVTSIKSDAFIGCAMMTAVEIPETVKRIGEFAFMNCQDLRSISLPPSVTNIGRRAFVGCKGLTSVTLPEGLVNIAERMLWCCDGLKSVTIPEGVTNIGEAAFEFCTALRSITIPPRVKNIEACAFEGCSELRSVTIPSSVTSIGYSAFGGCSELRAVEISSSVTNIDELVFGSCGELMSFSVEPNNPSYCSLNGLLCSKDGTRLIAGVGGNVTIPPCVTCIDRYAFSGRKGLVSLSLPPRVARIEEGAFSRCSGLVNVSIPSSVTNIDTYAFSHCSSIETFRVDALNPKYSSQNGMLCSKDGKRVIIGVNGHVKIPAGVVDIRSGAFDGFKCLLSFDVDEANTKYSSINGLLCSKDGKTLICGVNGDVTIPNGVAVIGRAAFSGLSGLRSVTIPSSVTNIEHFAFSDCKELKSIEIPNGRTGIGANVFLRCDHLECVRLPSTLTCIRRGTFDGCRGLKSLIIPPCVTSIEERAFEGCSELVQITIPPSVTHIGDYAFSRCSGLESVVIPVSVVKMGEGVFNGCGGLVSATTSRMHSQITKSIGGRRGGHKFTRTVPWFSGCKGLKSVLIPSDAIRIDDSAFEGWKTLESVTIPSNVTSIGESAFAGCSGLRTVTIQPGVTNIGHFAFRGCKCLTSLKIPDGVRRIGEGAFLGCFGLKSIRIPASVVNINMRSNRRNPFAIRDSENRNEFMSFEVDADNPMYSSRNGLLCSKDGSVVLAGVNGKVTIPACVKRIETGAFAACEGVTSFAVDPSNPSYSSRNGLLCSKDGATLLQGVNGDVIIPSCVTRIPVGAFSNCPGLTSVTIPSSVKSIEKRTFLGTAFYNNLPDGPVVLGDGLLCEYKGKCPESVMIPQGVKRIGEAVFWGCAGLRSVTIPAGVTSIGFGAFAKCRRLESVAIPPGVTSIGAYAFSECSALRSVEIPSSVTCIGSEAFSTQSPFYRILPDGLVILGDGVLYGCKGRCSPMLTIPPQVTRITESAFASCRGLTSVVITTWVKTIPGRAFTCCPDLESVTISNGVTSIGVNAFRNCRRLKSVTIPPSVTNIDAWAFGDCRNLTSFVIPETVTNIYPDAFRGCDSLASIRIERKGRIESVPFQNFCKELELDWWPSADVRGVQHDRRPPMKSKLKHEDLPSMPDVKPQAELRQRLLKRRHILPPKESQR